jgi:hypothetical protein
MVLSFIRAITGMLELRGVEHDRSKLEAPEVDLFDEYTSKLAGCAYGAMSTGNFLNR